MKISSSELRRNSRRLKDVKLGEFLYPYNLEPNLSTIEGNLVYLSCSYALAEGFTPNEHYSGGIQWAKQ